MYCKNNKYLHISVIIILELLVESRTGETATKQRTTLTPTSQPSTGSFEGLFEYFVALGAAVAVTETLVQVYLLDVKQKTKTGTLRKTHEGF